MERGERWGGESRVVRREKQSAYNFYIPSLLHAVLITTALEVLAQCQMIWMLLSMSLGWTLGSSTAHPFKDKNQLYTHTAVACLHIFLVLWEQSYDESHYTYHVHESLPGLLLMVLRITLAGVFGYNLKNTVSSERSTLRKDFYQSFAIVSYSLVVYCVAVLVELYTTAIKGSE